MRAAAVVALVLGGLIVTWWAAGDRIRDAWAGMTAPPAPHARYARSLEAAGLLDAAFARDWLSSSVEALADPPGQTLPFTATGAFDVARPSAAAWRFGGRVGRRIEIEVEIEAADAEVFVDLFRIDAGGETDRVASAAAGTRALAHEPAADAEFVVRVQPELLRGGEYTVRSRALATLAFPVRGASPRAVRSVFGDDRDRGARAHEGVDIFAPRGTPVVAAAGGWVTGSTTNSLGGNVVWVWDPAGRRTLYYAHLDRREVSPGARVRPGDVVGFVGNTGNARATAPHLHFGIYRPGSGAVDPLPFICDAPCGSRPGRRGAAASGGGTAYAR